MFLTVHSIVPIALGIIILLLAGRIADTIRRASLYQGLAAQKYRNILFVWPIRFAGIIALCFGFWISTCGPARHMMDKGENRLALLENGKVIRGEVTKAFYQHIMPAGWKVIYRFRVEDQGSNQTTYWGSAQGPKEYYAGLSSGDPVTIVYYPLKPKINCEIRYFLNHPGYRETFEEAGKLGLIDKFEDKCEIERYSFREWYRTQQQR